VRLRFVPGPLMHRYGSTPPTMSLRSKRRALRAAGCHVIWIRQQSGNTIEGPLPQCLPSFDAPVGGRGGAARDRECDRRTGKYERIKRSSSALGREVIRSTPRPLHPSAHIHCNAAPSHLRIETRLRAMCQRPTQPRLWGARDAPRPQLATSWSRADEETYAGA
jgi:hypothetical protein